MSNNVSRRAFAAGALGLSLSALCGVAGAEEAQEVGPAGSIQAGGFTLLPYRQFASGGVSSDLYAVILFENKNKTFTRYQVAYTSCTCRDAASNYRSVCYVEILNTKDTADEATIRSISFAQNDGVNVGVWGDSNPIHGNPELTAEYMNENLVQKFVKVSKAQVDAWEGYGTLVDVLDVDAVSGATVSTSNLTSLLKSLFAYHAEKYYA
ncbi:MAG: hypothetical protein E7211_19605 [Clostridium lundense]|nr:hypothetical protein [Clostridium lundense]